MTVVSFDPGSFVYEGLPTRVLFGSGAIERLPQEAERLGMSRAIIVCGAARAPWLERAAALLGERHAATFSGARMHTPVEVTDDAMRQVTDARADGIVSIGGGSSTGLAKAIALRTDLPQIAIPTTYAGSEMTPILGETEAGRKTTQRSPKVLPEAVIYDVDFTVDLPLELTGASGMNAVAHAIEALYARDANPVIGALALECVAALLHALPGLPDAPRDLALRREALYGAWLGGLCLGSVGMALHHKLCHTLGGMFDLPHAQMHAALLPHSLAYNAPAVPDVIARLSARLSADDPVRLLDEVNARLGLPRALAALGMPEDGIDRAADAALANPYWNPRPLERGAIRDLLSRAHAGADPRA